MKFKMVIVVECEDEGGVDAVWDAAAEEAFNNPDITNAIFVSAIQLPEAEE